MQEIADRLSELFQTDHRQTWVKVESQPRAHYAENGATPTDMVYPTFVEVLKAKLAEPEVLAVEADEIAVIVSGVLSCPKENTHILYLSEAAGRIAFGGKLLDN